VIGSHWLAYLLAVPDPHERANALARTGHGYWPIGVAVALGCLVAGLAGFAVRRVRRRDEPGHPYASTATRLVALQGVAFVVLEVVERVVAGAAAMSVVDDPAFQLGVVIQVLVASVAAFLLLILGRVVDAVVRRARRTVAGTGREVPRPLSRRIPFKSVFVYGGALLRAPPTASLL
jgi:hypothetical protein